MNAAAQPEIVVRRSVSVPLPTERAFELFTARMSEFWPPDHSIGESALVGMVIEPHVGGRWYELGADGATCTVGRVREWGPPGRVVLVWQISADWRYDPDLETEVEVDFVAESSTRTRLDLAHRHLERYGERAEAMRALFESPPAWEGILARYVATAAFEPPCPPTSTADSAVPTHEENR